jgi:hypothetical protein
MDDLIDMIAALVESESRSPRPAAIAILKAVAVTLRSIETDDLELEDCLIGSSAWIESELFKIS